MVARRMDKVTVSGVRRMFELAARIRNPVDLTIGQPDFDVPQPVKDAAIEAIRAGRNRYAPTTGLGELREAIARKLTERNGIRVAQDQVVVTSAGSGALTIAFLSLLDPGDEIIVPDPYFVSYRQLAHIAGAEPVFVDTYPEFLPDPDRIRAAITPRTRAIVINSPNNPTGRVYPRDRLEAIAEVADAHGLPIICDEVYEDFVYEAEHVSIGSFYPRTVTVNAFTKSHAMTGWRVGYLTGPPEVLEAAIKVQQFTFVCAPTPFQRACLVALGGGASAPVAEYRRKRDIIWDGLQDRYPLVRPEGAFYAFVESPYETSRFIEDAVRESLIVVPGEVFSRRDTHFRISYAAADETLRRGVEILRMLAERRA
ncbi:MAG: pyridoxal phosphate-dependent aminotransferase [Planctomycetes bacterium]|nr:pyridoxal phosphate-dependent aminotransferase [Planctomycetota bacterium]